MKILLFDIDGTLLLSGGAGRRAIDRAFHELFGVENAFDGVVPDGNTDPMIFNEIITREGIEILDRTAAFAKLARRYAHHLADEMPRSKEAMLMSGVLPLLDRLEAVDGVTLGLLTGNLEPTARIKLDRFGLNHYFSFGAFGSDDAVRERLVPIAVARAEVRLGRSLNPGRDVAVVGDTPKDVACALANGAIAVGVAASRYSVTDLERAGAHAALPNLEDADAFLEAIGVTG